MAGIRWRAIVFGLSADFLATISAGLVLSIVAGVILLLKGRPLSEIRKLHFEPLFLAIPEPYTESTTVASRVAA